MSSIKIAIIGCGKQAEKHIKGFQAAGNTEVVLADVNPSIARSLADAQRLTYYDSIDEVLSLGSLDAVDLCTPTPTHYPLICQALRAGKHVFCEKPMCESVEQAKEIQVLENQTSCFVQIGYIYKYASDFKIAAEELSLCGDSVLGRPLSAFFRIGGRGSHQLWKHMKDQGGGAIREMLVHMLDLANWYFGPLDDFRLGRCDVVLRERSIQGSVEKVDAEDCILISCVGKDGVQINFQGDMLSGTFSQYVEVQGENGAFMGSIKPIFQSFVDLSQPTAGYSQGVTILPSEPVNLYEEQMKDFAEAVRSGVPPLKNTVKESIEVMTYLGEIEELVR